MTEKTSLRIILFMRELPTILIEIAHYWAWLLRTGSMEHENTLEPNSAALIWFTDEAIAAPPLSVDEWDGVVMQEVVPLAAELVNPMWRNEKQRPELLERFAELLLAGESVEGLTQPPDLIVHLVDTPALIKGMRGGFEIWIHCAQGTYFSTTTLGLDLESQIALAPDAALRIQGPLAIDGYLRYLD